MYRFIKFLNKIAGVILICLPVLICIDIISRRFFNSPLLGILDITEMFGGLMIFLALPFATASSQQVSVDFFLQKFHPVVRISLNLFTRALGIFLFLLVGWNFVLKAVDFHKSGEISATLKLPLYPAAFVAAFLCFLQCAVLIADGIKRSRLK